MCSSKLMTLFDYLLIILLILIWWLFKNLTFMTPGVQFLQGDHQLFHENNSIYLYKLENLKKSELIDKIQEIDSKKHLEKSTINKLSLSEIRKLYFKKVIFLLSKMWTFLSKLTIFSIILNVILKFKLIRFIWILFSSLITFIFGLAYSDVYGFKAICYEIIEYFYYAIDYIHGTKFYHILTKILSSIKDVNEESIIDKTKTIEKQKEEIKTEIIETVIKEEVKETPSSFMTTNNPSSSGSEVSVAENQDDNRWNNKQEIINGYKKYTNKIDYSDVENSKWVDSPTTPKASSSKLPSSQSIMLPVSKE
uniref:Uncharacterized protein n=1 Tax=Lactarius sp. (in: basidiomycete fungi) TaxID=1886493 RepID=A0A2Z4M8X2_9AGAM|nr:hypothetical protein [Lactarius sp. (in: basidiomycete fungi)]